MLVQPLCRSRTACWVRASTLFLAFITASAWVAGPESAQAASAGKVIDGPVRARVLRIIDGDTIRVRATVWLGQHIEISVRLAGIDAPELRSRCTATRYRAWRARNRLHQLIAGSIVFLHDIRRGKYAGRVIANVRMSDGGGVGAMLLAAGLAEPYDGRRTAPRTGCPAKAPRTALVTGH